MNNRNLNKKVLLKRSRSCESDRSSRKRARGILGALESISLHDDGDEEFDDDSSHSPLSLSEEFEEDEEDTDDEQLLSDEEMLRNRLEQQVFHKLALGKDDADPTERRIAQIVLDYMKQSARIAAELRQQPAQESNGDSIWSTPMDLD